MANTFEISTYKPNQQLVLKSKEKTDTLVYYVAAMLLFLGISFTLVTASFFPILILGAIAFISSVALRYQLIHQITFTPTKLIVEYAIGFLKWQQSYNNIVELDWFVNVAEKQIKIGRKNHIILQFALDNLETLPLLTQNVSEIMSLEVSMNETVGKWENVRLRSPKQLPNHSEFKHLTIQKDSSKLKVLIFGIRRFEIDFKSKILQYARWSGTKKIDLKNIKAIHYYFENSSMVDNVVAKWAYVDKRTNETVLFFKFRRNGEQYEEVHYTQLNFKIDNRNLARLLQDLPEFSNIEIKEQSF